MYVCMDACIHVCNVMSFNVCIFHPAMFEDYWKVAGWGFHFFVCILHAYFWMGQIPAKQVLKISKLVTSPTRLNRTCGSVYTLKIGAMFFHKSIVKGSMKSQLVSNQVSG